MSRGNITEMIPDPTGLTVTFACRDGSTPSYHYGLADELEIRGGADPKTFTPDAGSGGGGLDDVLSDVGDAGEAVLDVSEGIADIGFLL